jgi:hypothetical protein
MDTSLCPAKTEKGNLVIKDRSTKMKIPLRSALILCDGKKSIAKILAQIGGMGVSADDFQQLRDLELVEFVAAATAAPAPPADRRTAPGNAKLQDLAPAERYMLAYQTAVQLTSGLGLKGFMLNLAVERADDLDALKGLAPKIQKAVGEEAFKPLRYIFDNS